MLRAVPSSRAVVLRIANVWLCVPAHWGAGVASCQTAKPCTTMPTWHACRRQPHQGRWCRWSRTWRLCRRWECGCRGQRCECRGSSHFLRGLPSDPQPGGQGWSGCRKCCAGGVALLFLGAPAGLHHRRPRAARSAAGFARGVLGVLGVRRPLRGVGCRGAASAASRTGPSAPADDAFRRAAPRPASLGALHAGVILARIVAGRRLGRLHLDAAGAVAVVGVL
mmetsp:Transcript_57470/g.186692  ORF Transcript_57470/g.186692 Transcript_57470/m.186692 type:complete len:223 (-) Transcript_57470:384-1052(-)